jgi:hypothetical protein
VETIQNRLIEQARRQYRDIYPCGLKKNLTECFTLHNNRLIFWFNTRDNTTHMLTSDLGAFVKD